MKKFALLSVSNKNNITHLAEGLFKNNYTILATGNTAKILSEKNIPIIEVSSVTEFPEIFNGRVKTLHPKIFGGILLRRDNENDIKEAEENNINIIDVVCVNLYPFVETVKKENSTDEEIIENIDIGGPSLVRASAKNHKFVSILTDPNQYEEFLIKLTSNEINIEYRQKLAVKAFQHTAEYDSNIATYFENKFPTEEKHFRVELKEEKKLRYGENPHQNASVYGNFSQYFDVFHGKDISYNNILDLISAVELSEDLGNNSCVIIKHNNPAGAAIGNNVLDSYIKALKTDPVSAFGGIVSFENEVDKETAEKLNEIFLEIIVAPSFSDDALLILKKKKDRRLVKKIKNINSTGIQFRSIPGGILVQDSDILNINFSDLKTVTEQKPNEEQLEDLIFAWKIAKHTKSNAIIFAKNKSTLGVGAGQMSRIDSAKIAQLKAKQFGLELNESVAASDAFFPFADGLLEIINCGATAVIQPGGSVRDNEVIEAANKNNISMVFTNRRHFKH